MQPLASEADKLCELKDTMSDWIMHGEEEDVNEKNSNGPDHETSTLENEVEDIALL